MSFEELLQLWAGRGVKGLRDAFEGPLLVPLEPWGKPAAGRQTVALPREAVASPPEFDETTSGIASLRVIRSRVGDRVPAGGAEILCAAKTQRNAYAHVAIGRSVQNDVVIDQASVSRFHADIRWSEQGYSVRDARSRNGTQLNGAPLRASHGEPLHAGDVITFGEASCLFCPLEDEALVSLLSRLSGGKPR